jgi:hypothetical protein
MLAVLAAQAPNLFVPIAGVYFLAHITGIV